MPEMSLVYMREMQNKMYSPSAFFLSKFIVSSLLYSFQPIIYSLFVFNYIGFNDTSRENFLAWIQISVI